MHDVSPIVFIIGVVIAVVVVREILRAVKRERLMKKYGDAVLVGKLMKGLFWEGQTAEQLIDSIGKPVEVDNKVMRSKTRSVWKYSQRSKRRFGLRITLENDQVVGWDKKA
jgi:hypothetical protein